MNVCLTYLKWNSDTIKMASFNQHRSLMGDAYPAKVNI